MIFRNISYPSLVDSSSIYLRPLTLPTSFISKYNTASRHRRWTSTELHNSHTNIPRPSETSRRLGQQILDPQFTNLQSSIIAEEAIPQDHSLPPHLQNPSSYMRTAPSASPPIQNGLPYNQRRHAPQAAMISRPGSRERRHLARLARGQSGSQKLQIATASW